MCVWEVLFCGSECTAPPCVASGVVPTHTEGCLSLSLSLAVNARHIPIGVLYDCTVGAEGDPSKPWEITVHSRV